MDVDDGVAGVVDPPTTYLGADVGQALDPGEIFILAGPEEVDKLHHLAEVLYCSLMRLVFIYIGALAYAYAAYARSRCQLCE